MHWNWYRNLSFRIFHNIVGSADSYKVPTAFFKFLDHFLTAEGQEDLDF